MKCWQSNCQGKWDWGDEGPVTLHLCSKKKNPKTQKHTHDIKSRAIHFICLGTTSPKKEGNTFPKEIKVLWSKPCNVPRVVWVLFKCLQKKTGCDFKSTPCLNQPRRPEMEEHFKNVEALIGIIFYYWPITHTYATFCSYIWKQWLKM